MLRLTPAAAALIIDLTDTHAIRIDVHPEVGSLVLSPAHADPEPTDEIVLLDLAKVYLSQQAGERLSRSTLRTVPDGNGKWRFTFSW